MAWSNRTFYCHIAPNYKEVIIHSSSFTEQDIGSLKQAAPNHSEQHRRVDRYEQRMVPGM